MTKKESFYYELMKVQNEVSMRRNGKPFKAVNLEEYITTTAFRKKADQLTMKKLEEEMAVWQKQLDALNEEEAVKVWLDTDEGKAYIKAREDRMAEIRGNVRAMLVEAQKNVSKTIKMLLGEQWDVISFGTRAMTVGIVEKYDEEGNPKGLFGHDFDIFYDIDWFNNKQYRWEMNYGTMGGFDLTEDNSTRIQHMVGIAKFASDKEKVPALRDYIHNMAKAIRTMDEEYWKLEQEVKNPKKAA